jgi:hypothetical protein
MWGRCEYKSSNIYSIIFQYLMHLKRFSGRIECIYLYNYICLVLLRHNFIYSNMQEA